MVVETGAVDTYAGPFRKHPFNYLGYYYLGKSDQLKTWEDDLRYILKAVQTVDDPNATQGGNASYNRVKGVWDPTTPTQADILNNVCQATSCN